MTRRRFSQMTSMVSYVGGRLVSKDEQVPIFFLSNFSEIGKHEEMTRLILETGDTSPALFSFSTFNTSVAQFSILNRNHSSVLAMSSIERAVETALIMANAHLQTQNEDRALIFVGEEAIPLAYKEACADYYRAFEKEGVFCLALLISKVCDAQNDSQYKIEQCKNSKNDSSILDLIDFLSTDQKEIALNGIVLERL